MTERKNKLKKKKKVSPYFRIIASLYKEAASHTFMEAHAHISNPVQTVTYECAYTQTALNLQTYTCTLTRTQITQTQILYANTHTRTHTQTQTQNVPTK